MIRESLKSRGKAIGTLLILALFIIAARSFDLQNQLRGLLRWIDSLGNWGPLMFILIYILACVLFLPGSLLTLTRTQPRPKPSAKLPISGIAPDSLRACSAS